MTCLQALILAQYATLETHPVLLFGEVHSKFGRSCCENRAAQERGRYELNNVRQHLLLLCFRPYFGYKFYPVDSIMLLRGFIFRKLYCNQFMV